MTNQLEYEGPAAPAQVLSEAEQSFEQWRQRAGIILAPVLFALVYWLTQGKLTSQGQRLSAILAAVAVLWMTEVLPLPVTGILGACLCILFGVAEAKVVLAPFADPIVFLFIGSFILAEAMMLHKLDRRLALGFLSLPWISERPGRVLAGLGVVTALISMWVSNTATTAMMFPIALGILNALAHARGITNLRAWPFATGTMLMVAYSASIGGIGTPVGSPPNLSGIGYIRGLAGVDISFFQWMSLTCPLLLVMGVALFVLLYLLHRPEANTEAGAQDLREYLRGQANLLGPWTRGQVNTLVAFALAVGFWMMPGILSIASPTNPGLPKLMETRLPESTVALLAAILLFILPVNLKEGRFTMTWREAAKIDWGTILLFGGGLSLGTLMFQTGVAKAMGDGITHLTGTGTLWTMTAVSIVLGIILSETTSNTAAANMVIPVVIALAKGAGINPVPPALGACLGASYGFMLPVSTPPNAIVYGSGLVPITKMMRAGIVFDVLGFVIILAGLRLLCPLLGLA